MRATGVTRSPLSIHYSHTRHIAGVGIDHLAPTLPALDSGQGMREVATTLGAAEVLLPDAQDLPLPSLITAGVGRNINLVPVAAHRDAIGLHE